MDRPVALVVDKDPAVRATVSAVLEERGASALGAGTAEEARAVLSERPVRLLFVDVAAGDLVGAGLLDRAARLRPEPVLIGLGPRDGVDVRPRAGGQDLYDVVPKPIDTERLGRVVRRSLEHVDLLDELRRVRSELQMRAGYHGIVGRSPAMERLRAEVERLATTDVPVWFVGEDGAGKELAARTLHAGSGRRELEFVVVDCAGLDEEAWNAQWTGDGAGPLARVGGGTLYLAELPALAPPLQDRLARALGAGDGAGSGPDALRSARLVVGSRHDPRSAAEEGRVVDALASSLGAVRLPCPPLRERIDDVPLLADHFVATICEINHMPSLRISAEAMSLLQRYPWPGNGRELRNAIEHAVILATSGTIRSEDLPDRVREASLRAAAGAPVLSHREFREAKREVVESFEQAYLGDLLRRHAGNVTAAARQAGMLRSALQRLLRKYRIRSSDYRRERKTPRPGGTVAPTTLRPPVD